MNNWVTRNSVSVNKLEDAYELEMEASPSPEDEIMEKEEKREITKLITDLIHQLIEQSPKHGFAALLLIILRGRSFMKKCILDMMQQIQFANKQRTF